MGDRRFVAASLAAGALLLGACSSQRDDAGGVSDSTSTASSDSTPAATSGPEPTGLTPLTQPTTTAPPGRTTTTAPRRTTTTTTTLVPVRSAANPRCVVRIREGDSLFAITQAAPRPAVTITSLQRENRIRNPDRIEAGDLLDICVGNGINDITGRPRVPPPRQRSG
jgi:hypothetical protein